MRLLGSVLLLPLLAGGVLAQIPEVNDQEILIGACTTLSGPSGFFGVAMSGAAQAYFNLVNQAGGVHARQLVFQPSDDKFDVAESTRCFKEQLDAGAFIAGLPVSTAASEKYAQSAGRGKLPFVGFFPGAGFVAEPSKPYVFAVRPSFLAEANAMVDHLSKDLGARRIGVVFQQDADGDEMAKAIRQSFKQHGATLRAAAGAGAAIKEKEDVGRAIGTLQKGNPDAVIIALDHELAAEFVKGAGAAGWRPQFLAFSVIGPELFLREAGPAGDGVIISQVLPPPTRNSELPAVKLYRKAVDQFKPRFNPSYAGFQGFVSALIMVEGLKDAGEKPTREGFIVALEAMRGRDIGLGRGMGVDYSKDHVGLRKVFFTYVEKGQLKPLDDWKKLAPSAR